MWGHVLFLPKRKGYDFLLLPPSLINNINLTAAIFLFLFHALFHFVFFPLHCTMHMDIIIHLFFLLIFTLFYVINKYVYINFFKR